MSLHLDKLCTVFTVNPLLIHSFIHSISFSVAPQHEVLGLLLSVWVLSRCSGSLPPTKDIKINENSKLFVGVSVNVCCFVWPSKNHVQHVTHLPYATAGQGFSTSIILSTGELVGMDGYYGWIYGFKLR